MRSGVEMGSGMASENDVYRPNLENLEQAEDPFVDNLGDIEEPGVEDNLEAQTPQNLDGVEPENLDGVEPENLDRVEAEVEDNLAGVEAQSPQSLDGVEPEVEDNLAGAKPQVEDNLAGAQAQTPQSWEECPLHNEGFEEDEEEDVDQFLSLAHMCRDEQLFNSYFEELIRGREQPNVENNDGHDDSCGVDGGARLQLDVSSSRSSRCRSSLPSRFFLVIVESGSALAIMESSVCILAKQEGFDKLGRI
ncbi:hypothetical protein AAHA92_31265 [Salvia divinorum]|uniref:Uncharacterized protein n=1 Tax=Salvia divinorum TaxID=28513 RepID=A0ABD1FTM3_SALDI